MRVRAWGADGEESEWSEPATVEAGLLDPADWSARFITPDIEEDTSKPQPAQLMRREFALRPGVASARLYITALGVYAAQINGAAVGDHVLAPGWTSYNHRLRYQSFDVTDMLREGPNAIGVSLGEGWYRGRLGFGSGRRNIYGDRQALLAQLEVTYADGSTERIATDEGWRAATGPILASEIYDGETYDARLERPGWATAGYDDADWAGVRRIEARPRPGGGLTSARARHRTPYGPAECAWELADGRLSVSLLVPPGTTADVILPGAEGAPIAVGPGAHRWSVAYQKPAPRRSAASLDSPVAEVIDDPLV